MLTQKIIRKLKQLMNADRHYTVPSSEADPNPEIIMPKGLNWDQKRKWAIETFQRELKRTDEKYKESLPS